MSEAPQLLDLAQRLGVAGAKFARPVREGQALIHNVAIEGDYWTALNRIVDHATGIRYKRLLMFFDPLAHLLRVQDHPPGPRDCGGWRPICASATTPN